MIRGGGRNAWLGLATLLALSSGLVPQSACLVPQSGESDTTPVEPPAGAESETGEPTTAPQEPAPLEANEAQPGGTAQPTGETSPALVAGASQVETSQTERPPAEPPQPSAQPDLPEDPPPVAPADPVEPATAAAAPAGAPAEASKRVDPPALPEPPSEVLDLVRRYYEALSSRDWGTAADCFWEGATITRLRAPKEGEPTQVFVLPAREVFERFESGSEGPPEGVQGSLDGEPAVQASGNVAQVWCRYVVSFRGPEEVMRWHRFDGVTLVLHEKVWKIAALVQGLSQDRP